MIVRLRNGLKQWIAGYTHKFMKPKIGLAEQKFNGIANNTARSCRARERERDREGRVRRIWYLSPMRAAKVQASLRIRAVSPEPSLLAHTSRESRGTFRQKARSLASLNGWTCAVKICHDGMLKDTNSLDAPQRERERERESHATCGWLGGTFLLEILFFRL